MAGYAEMQAAMREGSGGTLTAAAAAESVTRDFGDAAEQGLCGLIRRGNAVDLSDFIRWNTHFGERWYVRVWPDGARNRIGAAADASNEVGTDLLSKVQRRFTNVRMAESRLALKLHGSIPEYNVIASELDSVLARA